MPLAFCLGVYFLDKEETGFNSKRSSRVNRVGVNFRIIKFTMTTSLLSPKNFET